MYSNVKNLDYFDFIIVGGGIAGVVCAETLCELIRPSRFGGAPTTSPESELKVALISATPTVKTTVNLRRITNLIEAFDVNEQSADTWSQTWSGTLFLIRDVVDKMEPEKHLVYLKSRNNSNPLRYGRLCLTTGGVPRRIDSNNPYVIALRDTESLTSFQTRLRDTRRLLLVGNGGIATEIAHEVHGCEVVWAIKDASISTPFLDPSAARFLLDARDRAARTIFKPVSNNGGPDHGGDQSGPVQIRRMRYVVAPDEEPDSDTHDRHLVLIPDSDSHPGELKPQGVALGPDWAFGMELHGAMPLSRNNRLLKVVYKVRVERILTFDEFNESGLHLSNPFPDQPDTVKDWPVIVQLTNGEAYGCDLIVSAVGVEASFQPLITDNPHRTNAAFFGASFDKAPTNAGGGLLVDDQMQTSCPDVYAAGDCAFANWTWAPHWIQMRLWSQARQMGFQAAKAMFAHATGQGSVPLDFTFELFTHVTYFFGFKVVLLGLFNGQGLDLTSPDCYLLMRVTPGEEYVKCVMRSGRMQGALLIGETDMEETLENLIVNQLDLTNLENSLLDPNIDLSDYFD